MSTIAFEYTALEKSGVKRRGVLRAGSKADALRQVAALDLTPVRIKQVREVVRARGRTIRVKDIAHFTYQFSVLMGARIPIGEGLLSIAQQETNAKLREVITDIATRIEAGEQIANAMTHHHKVFGELYIQTIRAAERTGNLVPVLEHLSELLERQRESQQQVRSALMYPTCVVVVLVLAVTFLIGVVIPKFAKMFASKGQQLPIFTRILMAVGESMQAYWWAYLGAAVAGVFMIKFAWNRPRGRNFIEAIFHRIPIIKDILVGAAMSRFTRVLGLGVQSGVGLIDSIELASNASGRPALLRDGQRIAEQVRTGGRLRDVLAVCGYIPNFAKRMLSAGEESGDVPKMCQLIARHYERETAHLTKNIGTVIEPVLIVLIAGVVLVVALAIFLPMWDMVKLVS
ncbi:MAG: type II secretion system F family protein [Phycisphaeraceae bacterium]|nr:type II secretion system F family protein [Phycisphaeraceae bacterium]